MTATKTMTATEIRRTLKRAGLSAAAIELTERAANEIYSDAREQHRRDNIDLHRHGGYGAADDLADRAGAAARDEYIRHEIQQPQ